ncbi:MAG: cyclic lactone autoinducer peptide [Bacilli bacterium]|nr:cyclic lactone autoinducer peptide [Bacilli bacterium]
MENNNGTKKNKRVEAVFKIIEKVAEKKAEALCIGLLYEPEVPKKLKRK